MALPKQTSYLSVKEYLELERDSLVKYEYIDGRIYMMVGASDRHNRIARNICNRIDEHLADDPCEPFISDMKIWVSDSVFYYPDVVVACDPPGVDPYYRKKPILIIEVSSPGTERIDRSEKLLAYKQIKSLKEYVIVAQDRVNIEVFRRFKGDKWQWDVLTKMSDQLEFQSIDLTLKVSQIYRRVKFDQKSQ